jgi:hypothetical protein
MANTRQMPGSIRSRRTPVSRSATPTRRSQPLLENASKMQPKCDQNRRFELFNYSTPTTYNLNSVKSSHFPAHPRRASLNLAAESRVVGLQGTVEGYSFSLGEKVRMRDRSVLSGSAPMSGTAAVERLYTKNGWSRRHRLETCTKLVHLLYKRVGGVCKFLGPIQEGRFAPALAYVVSFSSFLSVLCVPSTSNKIEQNRTNSDFSEN